MPPTFLTFLQGENEEPESLRDLFKKNGVPLEDDDRFLWMEGGNVVLVEASPESVDLIEGITMAAG